MIISSVLHSTVQVGRVDRDLVKNLVVGYVVADDTKRGEILRWAVYSCRTQESQHYSVLYFTIGYYHRT